MAYPTVRPNDPLDQPSHSGLHNQHATDLEALQQTTADLTDLTVTLAGGNAGEVLGKSTNDDYDWEWIPAPTGGDGGDTYPGISTEQPNGLGIGTDGGLQVDPATLLSDADGQSITLDAEGKIYGTFPEVGPVGKVLQVVKATLTSDQTTNNTSAIPVPGWTITITPTKATSKIIFSLSARVYTQRSSTGDKRAALAIVGPNTSPTDAKEFIVGDMSTTATNLTFHTVTFTDYAEPTTTDPKTLSVLYHSFDAGTTMCIQGGTGHAHVYAYEIEEVSA